MIVLYKGGFMFSNNKVFPVILAAVFLIFTVSPAHAYLDAGTGSLILQIIAGGVAGLLVIGKLYWQKISCLFSRNKKEEDGHE